MASTPQLVVIEQAIIDALTAIAAATDSYNYTYASVSRDQRDIPEIARGALPAIDVAFNGETSSDEPGARRCVPTWLITAVSATTATSASAAATERRLRAARMRDDIKAALYGSTTLHGDAAIRVWFDQYDDDAAAPAARASSGGHASCRLLLKALYREPVELTPPTS